MHLQAHLLLSRKSHALRLNLLFLLFFYFSNSVKGSFLAITWVLVWLLFFILWQVCLLIKLLREFFWLPCLTSTHHVAPKEPWCSFTLYPPCLSSQLSMAFSCRVLPLWCQLHCMLLLTLFFFFFFFVKPEDSLGCCSLSKGNFPGISWLPMWSLTPEASRPALCGLDSLPNSSLMAWVSALHSPKTQTFLRYSRSRHSSLELLPKP